WGGIPGALDPKHKLGQRFVAEIEGLLTDEELTSAKDSTLNAHFTSIPVIQEMHRGLVDLGLPADALILEPSAGVGHFIGAGLPTYRWFGVELDAITGRIASKIYPKQDINVRGDVLAHGFNLRSSRRAWRVSDAPFLRCPKMSVP
ncbi:MAG: hypothetical protein IID07_08375, partial [Gemmatimonadetes bacterium]|nr:hypothetical protein [Gemmatimonadota bacterium]